MKTLVQQLQEVRENAISLLKANLHYGNVISYIDFNQLNNENIYKLPIVLETDEHYGIYSVSMENDNLLFSAIGIDNNIVEIFNIDEITTDELIKFIELLNEEDEKLLYPYAIKTSDEQNEEWDYFYDIDSAYKQFELLKESENDIHLFELDKKELQYEVINSYNTDYLD